MPFDCPIVPRRSFIFAPGLKPEMYPKALASGADIVCVELEDGIAPKDKEAARANALALFAEPQADDNVERIVRVNCLRSAFGIKDVQAVLNTDTPPPALMLPKVMTPDEVIWLDDLLTERGHETRLHIIIETNAGLEAVHDIARSSPRIDALFFGGVDMAAELRCQNDWEPLLYARSRVVHAAAGVGIGRADGIAPMRRRRRPPGTCRGDAGRGTRAAAVGAVRRIVVAATMAAAALPLPAHDLLQFRRHADTSGVVGGHLAFQYVCMRLMSVPQSTIKIYSKWAG